MSAARTQQSTSGTAAHSPGYHARASIDHRVSNASNDSMAQRLSVAAVAANAVAGAGGVDALESRRVSDINILTDGMRREWNFSLIFAHQAARLLLHCSPQWEYTFIDPERIEELNRLDRDVRHCPMTPVLRYTDFSAVLTSNSPGKGDAPGGGAGAAVNVNVNTAAGGGGGTAGLDMDTEAGSKSNVADGLWLEKAKHVEVLYSHIPPQMTLAGYCVGSVQHILKDPQVVSVDGDTDLTHLKIGSKLRCPYQIGGHRSFHFHFRLKNKSQLVNDGVYAIGTIINQRGYLVLVRCAEDEELEGYLQKLFLPFYCNPGKCSLDAEVQYREVVSVLPAEHLERLGELRYEDRNAAISFSLPMYPMRVRPDFSPAKTVGVGSIACMTLELNVYEKLIDDAVVAELTGMPKYKMNQVVLCLDIEDVSRMGYPNVMSTEQYSDLKAKRLLEVFHDAKVVGLPTTVRLGHRVGRSRTVTFAYEPLRAVAKAMLVSTLVGNFGVTALFLTKLGGGVFDTHLYLFQRLLNGVVYHQQNTSSTQQFSRFHVANIRLLEPDLARAYASAPPDGKEVMARHVKVMRQSNDGKAEGSVVVVNVPPEEGGVAPRHHSLGGEPAAAAVVGASHAPSFHQPAHLGANTHHQRPSTSSHVSTAVPGSAAVDGTCLSAVQNRNVKVTRSNSADMPSNSVLQDVAASANDSPTLSVDPSQLNNTDVVASHQQQHQHNTESQQCFQSPHAGSRPNPTDTITTNTRHGSNQVSAGTHQHKSINSNANNNQQWRQSECWEVHSSHSDSAISVTSISRLQQSDYYDEFDSNNEMAMAAVGGGAAVAPTPRDAVVAAAAEEADGAATDAQHHYHHNGAEDTAEDRRSGSPRRPKGQPLHTHIQQNHGCALEDLSAAGPERGVGQRPSIARVGEETADNTQEATAIVTAESAEEEAARKAAAEAAIGEALEDTEDTDTYFGPSLCDVYTRCCETQQCRPNSYLIKKLPSNPRLTNSVEEVDLTSNYLGHNGFVAVLSLLAHLPSLKHIIFNDMSLDNTDAENMCEMLMNHPSINTVQVRNNPKITLPSTRHFTRLLRGNARIHTLALDGTRLGEAVIERLGTEAAAKREKAAEEVGMVQLSGRADQIIFQ